MYLNLFALSIAMPAMLAPPAAVQSLQRAVGCAWQSYLFNSLFQMIQYKSKY
jgi:hypothetical protein